MTDRLAFTHPPLHPHIEENASIPQINPGFLTRDERRRKRRSHRGILR